MARQGKSRQCKSKPGMARQGKYCNANPGKEMKGNSRQGKFSKGKERKGKFMQGKESKANLCQANPDMVR